MVHHMDSDTLGRDVEKTRIDVDQQNKQHGEHNVVI